jgi:hypothetical protein
MIDESESHDQDNHLTPVAWGVLVLGVSLAIIVILWSFIGPIGSSYSSEKLIEKRLAFKNQYGFPPRPVTEDPNELEAPPSLRNTKVCIPYHICA